MVSHFATLLSPVQRPLIFAKGGPRWWVSLFPSSLLGPPLDGTLSSDAEGSQGMAAVPPLAGADDSNAGLVAAVPLSPVRGSTLACLADGGVVPMNGGYGDVALAAWVVLHSGSSNGSFCTTNVSCYFEGEKTFNTNKRRAFLCLIQQYPLQIMPHTAPLRADFSCPSTLQEEQRKQG